MYIMFLVYFHIPLPKLRVTVVCFTLKCIINSTTNYYEFSFQQLILFKNCEITSLYLPTYLPSFPWYYSSPTLPCGFASHGLLPMVNHGSEAEDPPSDILSAGQ